MNALFNNAVKTSEVILSFEKRYKDTGYKVVEVLSRAVSRRSS
jgi:hypothetical protein